jgi:hypothetical protein
VYQPTQNNAGQANLFYPSSTYRWHIRFRTYLVVGVDFSWVTELQRTQIDKCRSFMNSITVVPSSRDRWVFSWGQTNLWLPVTLPSCNSSLSTPHLSPHVQSIIPLELSLQEARRTRKTIRTEWKRSHEWRKSVSKSYPQRSNLCSRLHKCEPTQLIYKIKRERTHTTTTKSLWHCTFPLVSSDNTRATVQGGPDTNPSSIKVPLLTMFL